MHPITVLLAEAPLTTSDGISIALAGVILTAALAFRKWITDEAAARVDGDHELELALARLEARLPPEGSGVYKGPER